MKMTFACFDCKTINNTKNMKNTKTSDRHVCGLNKDMRKHWKAKKNTLYFFQMFCIVLQ